ncbi:MAG: hypothetical protein DWQ19_08735 [Crenarchaeota archaeon]|nr:MAG: hypothetical protein DWQ19_08735 [Thermoproteota archaeon]
MEKELIKILGSDYGGPSLSYQEGKFVIYNWYDAPVGTEVLGCGPTIMQAVRDYRANKGEA